jgi:hypothetical protein
VFTARGLDGVKVKVVSLTSGVMVPVTPGLTVKVVVLMLETFIASLKVAVMTAREHTPVAPFTGVTETTVGSGLHPLAAVLKLHAKSVARALPKVSWAPVVMVAVKTVLMVRAFDGVKVKMVLLTS